MLLSWLPETIKKPLRRVMFLYPAYLYIVCKTMPLFRSNYRKWIKKTEPNLWSKKTLDHSLNFSIVVPVFNTKPKMLKECVLSVLSQSYGNWELVLVNDASTNAQTLETLNKLKKLDNRIKLIHLDTNQHISEASNVGLRAAQGDFIGFLDHDDMLSPHALNEISTNLQSNTEVKWVYSDEDFISTSNKRIAPHFKTGWNLHLLRSHNYITHFCVYEKVLLDQLGGFRKGFEGAQDYDLALRVSERLKPEQIMHIPKVLYHWRVHKESSSSGSEAKPYTVEVGKQALIEHLERSQINAVVSESTRDNFYHVVYQPSVYPKISIIIPTRDQFEILKQCIESIFEKTDYPDYEIVLMDNQTSCPNAKSYLEQLSTQENVKIINYDKPFNYSAINNEAVNYCNGEVLVLLNNDTKILSTDWLKQMVGMALLPDVGCVGAKLLYPDNTIQHAGVVLGLGGYAAHSHRCQSNNSPGYYNRPHINQEVSAVTGACLVIRKSIYTQLSGLNEDFTVAYNDVDFCLRVQAAGYKNLYCAEAVLYHYESKTRGDDNQDKQKALRFEEEKQRLKKRWKLLLDNDPFYSPHLTRDEENFKLRSRY